MQTTFKKRETLNEVWWQCTSWKKPSAGIKELSLSEWVKEIPHKWRFSSESWKMRRSSPIKQTRTGVSQEEKTVMRDWLWWTQRICVRNWGKWDHGQQGSMRLQKVFTSSFLILSFSLSFLKSADYENHLNSEERVPNLILKKTDRQFSDWFWWWGAVLIYLIYSWRHLLHLC